MVLADEDIPKNWDVTSDSIAAWLTAKLGAEELILVKYSDTIDTRFTVPQLVSDRVLDASFDQFASRLDCPVSVIGKQGYRMVLDKLLSRQQPTRAVS
jgi:aspartokinase-like uncharacterized kinase